VLFLLTSFLAFISLSYTSSVPLCTKFDTPHEGWYWSDDGTLIRLADCKYQTVECSFVGTYLEGWYANDAHELVVAGPCAKRDIGDDCATNDDCGDDYCIKPTGRCSDAGACALVPYVCTKDLRPVCGCDGRNYSNPCVAASNGVSIDYPGWCRNDLNCQSNYDCTDYAHYCSKPDHSCASLGLCLPMPSLCTMEHKPVCGCNGQSFPNPCHAMSNGTNVDYYGECGSLGSCKNNTDCGSNEFCSKNVGDCSGYGECTPKPDLCSMEYDPVCGCDAATYSTLCIAFAEGMNVKGKGEC